jgi:hypothetical protein
MVSQGRLISPGGGTPPINTWPAPVGLSCPLFRHEL